MALLRERGDWPRVREEMLRRDLFAQHWVETLSEGTWCTLDRGQLLIDSTRTVLGERAIREMGYRRLSRAMDTGVLAPMLRSWARTVAPDTATLVRLTPHLWRASSQGLGELKVLEAEAHEGGGHARIRFTSELPMFLEAAAWHCFLEGFALGLLALRRSDELPPLDPDAHEGATSVGDRAHMRCVDGLMELELAWVDAPRR